MLPTNNKKDIHLQAIDWESSMTMAYQQSEARAWKIAYTSAFVAVLGIAGLIFMLPFYKVVPMTFFVDKATGESQLIDTTGTTPMSTAQMDKHWIEEYVNTRERYDWMLLQSDYERTMALSTGNVAKDYGAMFGNDNAIDKQLGNYTNRRIKIISTTLPPGASGTAIVRYERTTRERGYDTEVAGKYIATITYLYEKPSVLTLEKAIVANPMGFKVTGYVVDKEENGAKPVVMTIEPTTATLPATPSSTPNVNHMPVTTPMSVNGVNAQ